MVHVGSQELLIVAGVVLLMFGPKRLPELARGIGKSITEFRKGTRGDGEEPEQESPQRQG